LQNQSWSVPIYGALQIRPSVHLSPDELSAASREIPRKLSLPGSPSIKFSWFDGGRLSSSTDKRGRAHCCSDFLSSDSRVPPLSTERFLSRLRLRRRFWPIAIGSNGSECYVEVMEQLCLLSIVSRHCLLRSFVIRSNSN